MSKQALWNLNDLDDTKEPNMVSFCQSILIEVHL